MTTLEQELLQAATDAENEARARRVDQRETWEMFDARAARLRQRAARVRELERLWADDSFHRHELSMLTGPIPSETAPAAPKEGTVKP